MTIRGPFAVFLLLLLFVSLAANFLVAGFVAARVNVAGTATVNVDNAVAQAVRGFPPEIQRVIADATKTNRPALRAGLDAVTKARQQLFDAMRAQPFNPQALQAAFAAYRDSTQALQKVSEDVVADAIAQAPADIRRKIKLPVGPAPRIPAT